MLRIFTRVFCLLIFISTQAGAFYVTFQSGTTRFTSRSSTEYFRVLNFLQNSSDPKHMQYMESFKSINKMFDDSYLINAICIAPNWFIGRNSQIGQANNFFTNNTLMRRRFGEVPVPKKWVVQPSTSARLGLVLVKTDSFLKDCTPVQRYSGPSEGDDYYAFSNLLHDEDGNLQVTFIPRFSSNMQLAPVMPFSFFFVSTDGSMTLKAGASDLPHGYPVSSERGMPIFKQTKGKSSPFDEYKLAAIAVPSLVEPEFILDCISISTPSVSNWIGNTMIEDALEGGAVTSTTTTTSTSTASTNNNTRATMGASTTTSTTSTHNSPKQIDRDFEDEMGEKLGLELKGGDGYPISPFCLVTTQGRQVGQVAERSVIKDWSKPKQVVNYEQLNVSKVYHLPNDLALAYLKQPLLDVKFNLFDPNRHPESNDIDLYNTYVSAKAEDLAKKYNPYNYSLDHPTGSSALLVGKGLVLCIERMKIGSRRFEESKLHRANRLPDATDPLLLFWKDEIDQTPLPPAGNVTSYKQELIRLSFTPTFIHNVDQMLTDYRNNLNAISNLIIAEAIDAASPVRSY